MSDDWVVDLTFDADPDVETMIGWEESLAEFDGSVARVPGRGVTVTVYVGGGLAMLAAAEVVTSMVRGVVRKDPIGVEVIRESEWRRRAEAPTMPELMSAAEIAEELGVARQRVHQLRSTASFPAPLAELRGGAVWDAAAVRQFAAAWERKPGRPKSATTETSSSTSTRRRSAVTGRYVKAVAGAKGVRR